MFLELVLAAVSLVQKPGSSSLGLQLNVTVNGGVKELFDSVREEREMGCGLSACSIKWSDLGAIPGHINLEKLKSELSWRENYGFVTYLTLQTIDTNRRTVPTDLMNERWNSSVMLQREGSLLSAMAKVLTQTTRGFMLGNEVDAYLSSHRQEIAPYLKFLDNGRGLCIRFCQIFRSG